MVVNFDVFVVSAPSSRLSRARGTRVVDDHLHSAGKLSNVINDLVCCRVRLRNFRNFPQDDGPLRKTRV